MKNVIGRDFQPGSYVSPFTASQAGNAIVIQVADLDEDNTESMLISIQNWSGMTYTDAQHQVTYLAVAPDTKPTMVTITVMGSTGDTFVAMGDEFTGNNTAGGAATTTRAGRTTRSPSL